MQQSLSCSRAPCPVYPALCTPRYSRLLCRLHILQQLCCAWGAGSQGDNTLARQEFTRCLTLKNDGHPNIVGRLALAGLLFNMKQYKEALRQ